MYKQQQISTPVSQPQPPPQQQQQPVQQQQQQQQAQKQQIWQGTIKWQSNGEEQVLQCCLLCKPDEIQKTNVQMWPANGELNVKFIEQRFLTPQKLKG